MPEKERNALCLTVLSLLAVLYQVMLASHFIQYFQKLCRHTQFCWVFFAETVSNIATESLLFHIHCPFMWITNYIKVVYETHYETSSFWGRDKYNIGKAQIVKRSFNDRKQHLLLPISSISLWVFIISFVAVPKEYKRGTAQRGRKKLYKEVVQ